MTRSQDIAWAAGLFEGEGCFGAYARKTKWGCQARLSMTDRDVVERFAAIVGVGSVHEPRHKRAHEKPVHDWYVQDAADVQAVIELLLPWLGERRRAKALEVAAVAVKIQPRNGERTHCPQGHPYEGDNLVIEIRPSGVARRCKTCDNRRSRERQRRKLGITEDRYRV